MGDGSKVTALLRLRWPPTPLSRAEGARRADFGPSVGRGHPVASPYNPRPPQGGRQIAWPHLALPGGQPVPEMDQKVGSSGIRCSCLAVRPLAEGHRQFSTPGVLGVAVRRLVDADTGRVG